MSITTQQLVRMNREEIRDLIDSMNSRANRLYNEYGTVDHIGIDEIREDVFNLKKFLSDPVIYHEDYNGYWMQVRAIEGDKGVELTVWQEIGGTWQAGGEVRVVKTFRRCKDSMRNLDKAIEWARERYRG